VDGEGAEAASQLLEKYAYGGVALEQIGTTKGTQMLTVRAYLPADQFQPDTISGLRAAWWHLSQVRPMGRLTVRVVDDADWNDAWKRFFSVQRIGENIVIKPSWRDYRPSNGDIVIELDPGAAFGTGTHPTTVLCLEAIEEMVRPGMRVLDVGTGSGILAIAAAKFGANEVLALDTDPVAVRVARENCQISGVTSVVTTMEGSVGQITSIGYHLVLANIIADVLVELSPLLAKSLAIEGHLVTSGIIRGRVADVRRALSSTGLKGISSRRSGAWYSIRARRDE
jgi:ribosomal protein L11 methyltransferase